MRPICFLISWRLAGRPVTEHATPWVARHLAGCERCRAEAESIARLTAAIRQSIPDQGKCPVTWHEVLSRISARRRRDPASVRARIPAGAAVCAVVAIVLVVALLGPHRDAARPGSAPASVHTVAPRLEDLQPAPKPAAVVVGAPNLPDSASMRPRSAQPAAGSSGRPHKPGPHAYIAAPPKPVLAEAHALDSAVPGDGQGVEANAGPVAQVPPMISEEAGRRAADVLIGLSEQMTEEKSAEIQKRLTDVLVSAMPG